MRWRSLLPWLLALCVVLIFLAFQGRYVLRGTSGLAVYRMDRWTGEIWFIAGRSAYRIKFPEGEKAQRAKQGGRYRRFKTELPPWEAGSDLTTDLTTD